MTGLLALMGGREHRPGSEVIDRVLLRDAGVRNPRVAVLLAATTPEKRAYKIDEARRYWELFGAEVTFGFTGADDETEHALKALADPDLVVFTGGKPVLLHARIQAAPEVLDRVLELWRAGVPLSGSSAGAMAMCEWRPHLRGPRPLQLVRAFGLLPRTAAAPHYSQAHIRRATAWVLRRNPHVQILGIDDQTAVVGRGGVFQVLGRGALTLVNRDGRSRFPAGAQLCLP